MDSYSLDTVNQLWIDQNVLHKDLTFVVAIDFFFFFFVFAYICLLNEDQVTLLKVSDSLSLLSDAVTQFPSGTEWRIFLSFPQVVRVYHL